MTKNNNSIAATETSKTGANGQAKQSGGNCLSRRAAFSIRLQPDDWAPGKINWLLNKETLEKMGAKPVDSPIGKMQTSAD